MSNVVEEPRLVVRKFLARPQHEGVGAIVRRSIGRFELKYFDPFLVLDEFSVSAPAGFPDHPHTGFETVAYMLQASYSTVFMLSAIRGLITKGLANQQWGAMTHEDFEGRKGTMGVGDLQWMTAGRGIVHSEMPASQVIEPRYQKISSKGIPKATKDRVMVRVIAGESLGTKSPVYTRTPTMYLVNAGSHRHQPIPISWNAFVYVLAGEGNFGNSKSSLVTPHHLLLLGSGDGLEAWNKSSKPLRFVLVGGEPLGEPVVQFGPFVMNSQ
ncbi:unnamed protein product [Camellia sinensis]